MNSLCGLRSCLSCGTCTTFVCCTDTLRIQAITAEEVESRLRLSGKQIIRLCHDVIHDRAIRCLESGLSKSTNCGLPYMVAEQSCVKRLWTVVPELYQDGYGGTIGTAGAVSAAGRQCVTSCKTIGSRLWRQQLVRQLRRPRWWTCVCSGNPLSLLETKRRGRAGASSCCLSQQQSRRNYVH